MALMRLHSNNPYFSHIIGKNPSSGMTIRKLRKGHTFGWFSDEQNYHVYFKDADNDISFKQQKEEEFEYLNLTRYNSPIFPLSAITLYFDQTAKNQHEHDKPGFQNECFVNMVCSRSPRYFEFFNKQMKDFEIIYEEIAPRNYQLTIKTKRNMQELIQFTNIVFLFLTAMSEDYFHVEENVLGKHLEMLVALDPPYYIRYLFSKAFLRSRKKFRELRSLLETTNRDETFELVFGDTRTQRKDWVTDKLDFARPIMDLGCGEGFYAASYAKKSDHPIFAIDIDEEARRIVERKRDQKELNNLFIFESLEHFIESSETYNELDVVLSEVIEHMTLDEAKELILHLMKDVRFHQIIITTPNRDFNPQYAIGDGFRHLDHKWESGTDEFKTWMSGVLDPFGETVEWSFHAVGDQVSGKPTSQGVIIKRKGDM